MKNNKNIFLQIIAIIGAVLLFLLIITLLVFRNELCSLASLQLVDEYGMYQMTYYGDYGFDEFLEIGAESDADIEAFVTKRLLKGLPISLSETGDGCTAFVVKNEEGEILFGRNFDFMYAPSLQLYTDPKNGYASISTVNLAFAGYSEEYLPSGLNFDSFLTLAAPFLPFDGMNEKGVAIALLAVPEAQPPYNSEHVTLNTTTAIRLVLDKAATTEEAVELLRQYNVYFSADVTCHYLIADASGHSVIVEYYDNDIKVVETDKEYQIASNFIAYNDLNIGEGSTEFDRYNAVQNAIEENHGVLDEDQVIMLLSQIGVKNGNIDKLQWSVLYNLTNGDGQIFAHRKTDQIVKIHIDKSGNVEADSDDNNATEKIENKKIIVAVTENSNYVYHMLSVAKCGYDNAYGDKYKELYSKEDLAILKENASAITVVGGEHEGSLYTPLIADAAALDDSESIVDYYRSVIENAERIAKEHGEQKETVEALANVFIKCYKIYNEKVWPADKEKAEAQVALFQQKFDEMDLVTQWEAKLGYRAKEDFYVMFVDSIENGPEAILITDNKDIFTIPDSECFDMKINFFSHELGVSIIRQNGFYGMTDTSEMLKYYSIFEGVAEYYNRQIFDGYELADTWDYDMVNKIQKIDEENQFKNANELFWAVVETIEEEAYDEET